MMWLLHAEMKVLRQFHENRTPGYAILSHTWGDDEVSFEDVRDLGANSAPTGPTRATSKEGWAKIELACKQAVTDRLKYVWVDTCCIVKSSSAELQESINSMYRWYGKGAKCYAFLSDILAQEHWSESRWFTRGWTLQELIAPKDVTFYDQHWREIGTKTSLLRDLSRITGIEAGVLQHRVPLSAVSIAKRMSWAARRQTSRVEDMAYSLLGIFEVNMPMLYGEGGNAFIRLQEEIIKNSTDHSIFAWESTSGGHSGELLAPSPANFLFADRTVTFGAPKAFGMTNKGLSIELPTYDHESTVADDHLAALNCRLENDVSSVIALRLTRYPGSDEHHAVVGSASHYGTRLVLLPTRTLPHNIGSTVSITRKYQHRQPRIEISVEISGLAATVLDTYPRELWNSDIGVVDVVKQPSVRAAVLYHIDGSDHQQMLVIFGFECFSGGHDDGVLPCIAMRSWSAAPRDSERTFQDSIRKMHPALTVDTEAYAFAHSADGEYHLIACMRKMRYMGITNFAVTVDIAKERVELDASSNGLTIITPASSRIRQDMERERRTIQTQWETKFKRKIGTLRHPQVFSNCEFLMKIRGTKRILDIHPGGGDLFSSVGSTYWKLGLPDAPAHITTRTIGVLLESATGGTFALFLFVGCRFADLVDKDAYGLFVCEWDGRSELRDAVKAVNSCNRGESMCGYAGHDRNSRPRQSARMIGAKGEQLAAHVVRSILGPKSKGYYINVSLGRDGSDGSEGAREDG